MDAPEPPIESSPGGAALAAPTPGLLTPASPGPLKAFFRRLRRHPWFLFLRLRLRRFAGLEPWLRVEVRTELENAGGWQFCAASLRPGQVAYSGGIGTNIQFETLLATGLGLEVHAFDPTPACREWLEEAPPGQGFHFHPWALGGQDGILTLHTRRGRTARTRGTMLSVMDDGTGESMTVPARTVGSLCRELGHGHLALLKLDIEGAEYPVITELLASACRPDQILVEFHHRFPGIGPRATAAAVAGLRAAGYRIAALSPTGREVTFLLVDASPGNPR